MKVKDFKFKLTDLEGNSAILSFGDFFGYEGEVSGVIIRYDTGLPEAFRGVVFVWNHDSIDDECAEWKIEMVE